jgi:hypothetical protein
MSGKTAILGLGGCGAKAVEHLLEKFESRDQFVVIDNSSAEMSPQLLEAAKTRQFQALHLTSDMPNLRQIIFEGSDCDPRTPEGQLKLKKMSSWRVRPNAAQFPLAMGAGQYRGIGATVAVARLDRIREVVITAVDSADTVFVISSTSGGTGSSMITRVVDEVLTATPSARVSVILVTNYPPFMSTNQQTTNSYATLLEILSMCHRLRDKELEVHLVDGSEGTGESGWLKSVEAWTMAAPRGIHVSINELRKSIRQAASNVLPIGNNNFEWAWARSRPILEACGMSDEESRRFMRGFVRALCEGAIGSHLFNTSVDIKSPSGELGQLLLLRRVFNSNELLPVALESYLFNSSNLVIGKNGSEIIEEWADQPFSESDSTILASHETDAVGYNAHYLGSIESQLKSSDGSIDLSRFVRRQLALTHTFLALPYDGSEGLENDGMPHPADVFFRDIAPAYESVLSEISSELEAMSSPSVPQQTEQHIEASHLARTPVSPPVRSPRRLPSSSRSMKPFWFVRYAVPAALAVVSGILFVTAMSSGTGNRQTLSESSTVVAGLMGGLAVCLGAIALISSIQNSSITTLRTDKLFSSCVGVIEGIDMFSVALDKARLTPTHAAKPTVVWSHPSVQIAVEILGRRLSSCLDDGLFGLLQFRDRERGASNTKLDESLALKVFVLVDDLARVSPGALTNERSQNATPATAENILLLAWDIRNEIESLSYRDMARSLRGN